MNDTNQTTNQTTNNDTNKDTTHTIIEQAATPEAVGATADASSSTEASTSKCCKSEGKAHCHGKHRCKKRWLMVALLLAAGVIGAALGRGCTHERGEGYGRGGGMSMKHDGMNAQGQMQGMGGRHGGMFNEQMVERMGEKVNATDEQKQKLKDIASKYVQGQNERQTAMQSMRQKSMQLLSSDPVDTAAVEQVRASQIAYMDEQSKRMTQAMTEAAQVLTPEQRKQLAQMMPERRW